MQSLDYRRLAVRAAAILVVLAPMPGLAWAGGHDPNASQARFVRLEGQVTRADRVVDHAPIEEIGAPITSGCVILDGEWIRPPYVVSRRDGQVYLNGLKIDHVSIFPELGGRGGRGPGKDESPDDSARSLQVRVESLLLNAGVMIRFPNGAYGAFRDSQAYFVLDALMSDEDSQGKLRVLVDQGFDRFTSAQWLPVVERLRPTRELRELLSAFEKTYKPRSREPAAPAPSGASTYALTLAGMGLAVFSFGVVLNHRPQPGRRWRELNAAGDGSRLVVNCVALIALLSAFDLACTYLADRAGGFWEINPLASLLLESPLYLVAFKAGFTTLSIVLLLRLRRYQGMQVASWWMCLTLTLLTVRWVAFHSMSGA